MRWSGACTSYRTRGLFFAGYDAGLQGPWRAARRGAVRWPHRAPGKAARLAAASCPSPSRPTKSIHGVTSSPSVQALPCGGSGKSVPRRRRFTPDADNARRRGPRGARCIHMGRGVFLPLYGPCTVAAIHVAFGSVVWLVCHKHAPHVRVRARGHAVSRRRDAGALNVPRTRQTDSRRARRSAGCTRCLGLIVVLLFTCSRETAMR